MKIIVALNAFKGTFSSKTAGDLICNSLSSTLPENTEVEMFVISDGGDGFLDAFILSKPAYEIKSYSIFNRILNKNITVKYGVNKTFRSAVIEYAQIAGMALFQNAPNDPLSSNSYALGLLISDLLNNNYKDFYIGIGGSSTVDCGIGMANALGYKFYDQNRNLLDPIPVNLANIEFIETPDTPSINNLNPIVFCDVNNKLTGENGAICTYGEQKGLSQSEIVELERGFVNFGKKMNDFTGRDIMNTLGSGAAGGIGAGMLCFLNAKLINGCNEILTMNNFFEEIKDANLVITGEGIIDNSTLFNKGVCQIAREAKKHNVKVIGVCGNNYLKDSENLFDFIIEMDKMYMKTCSYKEKMIKAGVDIGKYIYSFAKGGDER